MHRKSALLLTACLLLTIFLLQHTSFDNSMGYVAAVETQSSLGVYWDSACTKHVSSISWGNLTPGGYKYVYVYVRNEGNETTNLSVRASDWNPTAAETYLRFSWTSTNDTIEVGQVVKVKQKLQVSEYIIGISSFGFSIVFESSDGYLVWDVNKDGNVNIVDLVVITLSYGTTPSSLNWDPRGDVDENGIIDLSDMVSITSHYGDTFP